jgi:hypothetical protein
MTTGTSIGVRNATYTSADPTYKHFGYLYDGCTPTSGTQCCVDVDARARYDFW